MVEVEEDGELDRPAEWVDDDPDEGCLRSALPRFEHRRVTEKHTQEQTDTDAGEAEVVSFFCRHSAHYNGCYNEGKDEGFLQF